MTLRSKLVGIYNYQLDKRGHLPTSVCDGINLKARQNPNVLQFSSLSPPDNCWGGGEWTLMHNDYKQKCAQLSRNAQGLFSLCQFLGNEEVCFALVIIVHLIEWVSLPRYLSKLPREEIICQNDGNDPTPNKTVEPHSFPKPRGTCLPEWTKPLCIERHEHNLFKVCEKAHGWDEDSQDLQAL